MKIIHAPLCAKCASLIGETLIVKEYRPNDRAERCPWCENRRADMIYKITLPKTPPGTQP